MNKFLKFMPAAIAACACLSFTACSDDDDPKSDTPVIPSVDNVFTGVKPSTVDGATYKVNDKGQVTVISYGSEKISFEYGTFTPSRAHNFTVLMKCEYPQYPSDNFDIYMELNEQGFVQYAYEVYADADNEAEEWWFGYNAAGQLNSMKRSESGDTYVITYTDGDITKVVKDDEDGDHSEYTIAYTNDANKTPVANTGSIMLFDEMFCVDMDEMGVVYFAGMLGKPTKNLPMGNSRTNSLDTETKVYHWEFNADKLPLRFWAGDYEEYAVNFTW